MTETFNEDYFLRGPETGLSNYTDYSWKPELTIPAAKAIIRYLGIEEDDLLLDYACARGYYVRAYRELGIMAWGYDISKWAIENCDPSVKKYVDTAHSIGMMDWIICKDGCEHFSFNDLRDSIRFFLSAKKGALICVPITNEEGQYILNVDEQDSTHIVRWTFQQWLEFLQEQIDLNSAPFTVSGSFRLPGLKEYGGLKHNGCGFFTLKRHQL